MESQRIKGSGVVDYVSNVFSKNSKYTNSTKKTLDKYGNFPIVGLQIMRQPIISAIDSALNILSLGSWEKLKAKNSFDKLFHLFAVFTVKLPSGARKEILVEKNQSINVSENIPSRTKDTGFLTIAWGNRQGTLNSLLDKTLEDVGSDRFYVYRPFNDNNNGGNCQRFISDVLESNGLLGDNYRKWILQDVEELVKGLPNYVLKFSKGVTDFASGLEKLIGGEKPEDWELHAVVIKNMGIEEAQKIAQDIIKNKKKGFVRMTKAGSLRFRNIPKTKFKPRTFKTKKINENVSLVFGELK